ncbi:MAG: PrgI family protein, partial [Candidatus Paceibacterota bacterium]
MRFEVPQFIEIEDKIFGPLTWKQFVYVAGGGGLTAVLFFFTPFIIFIILGIPVAAFTFLLSFYPVNNRPFASFLESATRYFKGTKLYLWRKNDGGVYGENTDTPSTPAYMPPSSSDRVTSLARRLEMKAIQKE